MYQTFQQTDEEKMAMYMKLSKNELAQMLIQANKHLENRQPVLVPYQPLQPIPAYVPPFYYGTTCETTTLTN